VNGDKLTFQQMIQLVNTSANLFYNAKVPPLFSADCSNSLHTKFMLLIQSLYSSETSPRIMMLINVHTNC